jgi:hypothetical protein
MVLELDVTDEQALIDYAKRRHVEVFGPDGEEPQDVATAAFDALLAANADPTAPEDYGIELDHAWYYEVDERAPYLAAAS